MNIEQRELLSSSISSLGEMAEYPSDNELTHNLEFHNYDTITNPSKYISQIIALPQEPSTPLDSIMSSFQRCMTKNESPPPIIWRKGDGRARDKGCTSTTNYSTNQEFSSDKEEPVVIRLLRRIDAYKEQSSPNRKGKGNSPVSNLLEKEEKFTQEAKFNSSEKYPLPKENYKRRFSPQVGYRSSAIVDKHDFHSEQYTQREKRQGCTSQESRLCPRTSFTRKCKQLSARGIMEFPNSPSTFVIGKNDLTPLKDYLDRLKVIRKKYSDILLKLSLEEGMDIKHIVAKKKDFHTSPKSFKFTSKAGIAQQIINDAFREAYSKEEVLKVVQEVEENYKITRTLLGTKIDGGKGCIGCVQTNVQFEDFRNRIKRRRRGRQIF